MPKIFISYRREDSKHAVGRLHAALTRHVRNPKRDIFIDIDNIPRGVDFVDHLDGQVAQCDVMLAVIGPSWLTATDAKTGKRRLDDPHDFVRIEVASALKRGIPVVPVVLDDTKIPVAEDLPDDLRLLARRNGERLEHESFDADVTRLIKNLPAGQAKPLLQPSKGTSRQTPKPSGSRGWVVPAVGFLALVLGGAGAWAWFANPGDWRGTGIRSTEAQLAGTSPSSIASTQTAAIAAPNPITASPVTEPNRSSSEQPAATSSDTPPASGSTNVTPPPAMTLKLTRELTLPGATRLVGFRSGGSQIVTEKGEGTAQIWDARTGDQLSTIKFPEKLPPSQFQGGGVDQFKTIVSPDGRRIAISASRTIASFQFVQRTSVWDVDSTKLLFTVDGFVDDGGFSPDGKYLETGVAQSSRIERIWDTATGAAVATIPRDSQRPYGDNSRFSSDSKRLVLASYTGFIEIYDAKTGGLLAAQTESCGDCTPRSLEISADGTRLLTGSADGLARVWDGSTGNLVSLLKGHTSYVQDARFSPADSAMVVTASYDGTARVWNAITGQKLRTLKHGGPVNSAEFSPDGSQILTSSRDRFATVWDAKSGAKLGEIRGSSFDSSATFSPDGTRVIVTESRIDVAPVTIWKIERQ